MSTIVKNCEVTKSYGTVFHYKEDEGSNGLKYGNGYYVSNGGVFVELYTCNGLLSVRLYKPSVDLHLRYNGKTYIRKHEGIFSRHGLQMICAAFVRYVTEKY